MDIREQIREAVGNCFTGFTCGIRPAIDTCSGCGHFTDEDRCQFADDFVKELSDVLSSLGVCIKVESELPPYDSINDFEAEFGKRPKDIVFKMAQCMRDKTLWEAGYTKTCPIAEEK